MLAGHRAQVVARVQARDVLSGRTDGRDAACLSALSCAGRAYLYDGPTGLAVCMIVIVPTRHGAEVTSIAVAVRRQERVVGVGRLQFHGAHTARMACHRAWVCHVRCGAMGGGTVVLSHIV